MIETAVVLPVYFCLVFGIMQLCFVLFGYCNATYACRQVSRFAAVHGTGSTYQATSSDLQNIAKQYLWGCPTGHITVTTTWSPDNNPGSTIIVKISMVYRTVIPFSTLSQITVGTSAQALILQ
jgi:Flp pilus assembly protein TadG